MSTILKCRERQRQRKRESMRQASEAQRGKKVSKKQRRRISSEEQHENFVAVVRKGKMLTDSKVKMGTGIQATKFFVSAYNIFSIKRVTWKFIFATTAAKLFLPCPLYSDPVQNRSFWL